MQEKLKVAGFQTDVKFGSAEHNLQNMESCLDSLAEPDIFLAVFPECYLNGYCCQSLTESIDMAVDRDHPWINQAASLAQRFQVNLVFGFLERDGDTVFNTAALLTREGPRHFYRKVHLPCLGVDQFTTPGCEFPVVSVEGVKIGVNICYDCSFPEPARVMALAGADLIVLPTNWPPGAGTTADYIPNARALENNVYFMAVNRIGDERGFHFIGKSKICHPDGHDLAFADHDRSAVVLAEIEPAVARNKHLVRVPGKHEINRMADRRPDTYHAITGTSGACGTRS